MKTKMNGQNSVPAPIYCSLVYICMYIKLNTTHIGKMSYILVFSQQNRILRISCICLMFYLGHKILKGMDFMQSSLKLHE